jgi:uncharacterized membrane protein YagU involved in acid resistance
MGVMPELDVIKMLSGMMGGVAALGWMGHFMIGIIYGLVFALIQGKLPGGAVIGGIILGIAGWLMMMVAVMPMMGVGFFGAGLGLGMMAPVATLMLHVIFGAVLGGVYKMLSHCG